MRAALFAEETGETPIHLLTIEHPSFSAPERLCDDRVSHVSRGQTFTAFPFVVTLPDDVDDTAPLGQVQFDNISREITAWLRRVLEAPTVLIEVVLASDPDTVLLAYPRLRLGNVQWPAGSATISASLTLEDVSQAAWPADTFNPSSHPGLFA